MHSLILTTRNRSDRLHICQCDMPNAPALYRSPEAHRSVLLNILEAAALTQSTNVHVRRPSNAQAAAWTGHTSLEICPFTISATALAAALDCLYAARSVLVSERTLLSSQLLTQVIQACRSVHVTAPNTPQAAALERFIRPWICACIQRHTAVQSAA